MKTNGIQSTPEHIRLRPDQVFTPRNAEVNTVMYVHRPLHETRLQEHLQSASHTVIYGESGSGKSWLYKKILGDEAKYWWIAVNMANATHARGNSIVSAISQALADPDKADKVGYKETKEAAIGMPSVASGKLSHESQYSVQSPDPLLGCMQEIRNRAKSRQAVVVLDNLEAIFDDTERMKELGNIILLADDPIYSKCKIKFLIVGVVAQIRDYYAKLPNFLSVTTRLIELPEVSFFSKYQTDELVSKGFQTELGLKFSTKEINDLKQHVHFVTLGLPFYIHEYCLELARVIVEQGGKYNRVFVRQQADSRWLETSLSQVYGAIEALMNSRVTKVGRKNQVLYALGQIADSTFDAAKIEKQLEKSFPELKNSKTNLNVGTMLGDIEQSQTSPIRRLAKGNQFAFSNPKFRMCLRTMLYPGDDGRVVKLDLGQVAKNG